MESRIGHSNNEKSFHGNEAKEQKEGEIEFVYKGWVKDIDTPAEAFELTSPTKLGNNEVKARLKDLYKEKTGAIYLERLKATVSDEPVGIRRTPKSEKIDEQLNLFH